ncbi:MAG TPA: sigma 54-interacting transcriptional regulator [Terriglobales bacterium]|nr:sigma 54-interacting transcriptional regulator [Terriglobales bacterium]
MPIWIAAVNCATQVQVQISANDASLPRLIVLAGPMADTVIALRDPEVTIGRGVGNQVCISDPILSRQHCLIKREDDGFIIRDLGSRHGTAVNGVPINQQVLHHGDQISLGRTVLSFLLQEDEAGPQRSRVELDEESDVPGAQTLLKQEDALYLQKESITAEGVQNGRLARDLNTLLIIAKNISKLRESESLAWQLLGMIFDVIPADRGAILSLADEEQINWSVAWDRLRGPGLPVRVSRTILSRVLREQSSLMISQVPAHPDLSKSSGFGDLPVQALMCVPLTIAGRIAAVIYLDTQDPKVRFDDNHLQMLTAIGSLTSLALENISYVDALKRENRELRTQIAVEHNMVGQSPRMREVFELVRRVAPTDSTVLIQGESGTGKELVAHAIHSNSRRGGAPFVAINCAAIAETLLESELFGYEKGAFTGAVAQKKGKIEVASGGTLFLDEIGELALPMQAKLLRVLQEREFERVGGTRSIKVDLRLIAATNQNLQEWVQSGNFRKDLYYRLNVVSITVPPLRDRREDIPDLADYFIAKTAKKCNTRIKTLTPPAKLCLMNYDWPGNVRELENALERALVLGSTEAILVEDLPEAISEATPPAGSPATKYAGAMKDTKRQVILQALQDANGNYIEAAKCLGLHPNSLLRLIRRLDLKVEAKRMTS